jgi:hypothetical protein
VDREIGWDDELSLPLDDGDDDNYDEEGADAIRRLLAEVPPHHLSTSST